MSISLGPCLWGAAGRVARGSVGRAVFGLVVASVGPPPPRPISHSSRFTVSSSSSGAISVRIRTHAFRNIGWSRTSPTGSVS